MAQWQQLLAGVGDPALRAQGAFGAVAGPRFGEGVWVEFDDYVPGASDATPQLGARIGRVVGYRSQSTRPSTRVAGPVAGPVVLVDVGDQTLAAVPDARLRVASRAAIESAALGAVAEIASVAADPAVELEETRPPEHVGVGWRAVLQYPFGYKITDADLLRFAVARYPDRDVLDADYMRPGRVALLLSDRKPSRTAAGNRVAVRRAARGALSAAIAQAPDDPGPIWAPLSEVLGAVRDVLPPREALHAKTPEEWAQLRSELQTGWDESKPLRLHVNNGELSVNEGKHRLYAAMDIGLEDIPVEVTHLGRTDRYRDGDLLVVWAVGPHGDKPDDYYEHQADAQRAFEAAPEGHSLQRYEFRVPTGGDFGSVLSGDAQEVRSKLIDFKESSTEYWHVVMLNGEPVAEYDDWHYDDAHAHAARVGGTVREEKRPRKTVQAVAAAAAATAAPRVAQMLPLPEFRGVDNPRIPGGDAPPVSTESQAPGDYAAQSDRTNPGSNSSFSDEKPSGVTRSAYKRDSVPAATLARWTSDDTPYAVFSSHTSGQSISETKKAFEALIADLRSAGYTPVRVRGKWEDTRFDPKTREPILDPTGQPTTQLRAEPAVLVRDISFEVAVNYGRAYKQNSIIYKDESGVVGMYDLESGQVRVPASDGRPLFGAEAVAIQPTVSKQQDPEHAGRGAPSAADLYSRLRGSSFAYQYDWDADASVLPFGASPVTRAMVEEHYAPRPRTPNVGRDTPASSRPRASDVGAPTNGSGGGSSGGTDSRVIARRNAASLAQARPDRRDDAPVAGQTRSVPASQDRSGDSRSARASSSRRQSQGPSRSLELAQRAGAADVAGEDTSLARPEPGAKLSLPPKGLAGPIESVTVESVSPDGSVRVQTRESGVREIPAGLWRYLLHGGYIKRREPVLAAVHGAATDGSTREAGDPTAQSCPDSPSGWHYEDNQGLCHYCGLPFGDLSEAARDESVHSNETHGTATHTREAGDYGKNITDINQGREDQPRGLTDAERRSDAYAFDDPFDTSGYLSEPHSRVARDPDTQLPEPALTATVPGLAPLQLAPSEVISGPGKAVAAVDDSSRSYWSDYFGDYGAKLTDDARAANGTPACTCAHQGCPSECPSGCKCQRHRAAAHTAARAGASPVLVFDTWRQAAGQDPTSAELSHALGVMRRLGAAFDNPLQDRPPLPTEPPSAPSTPAPAAAPMPLAPPAAPGAVPVAPASWPPAAPAPSWPPTDVSMPPPAAPARPSGALPPPEWPPLLEQPPAQPEVSAFGEESAQPGAVLGTPVAPPLAPAQQPTRDPLAIDPSASRPLSPASPAKPAATPVDVNKASTSLLSAATHNDQAKAQLTKYVTDYLATLPASQREQYDPSNPQVLQQVFPAVLKRMQEKSPGFVDSLLRRFDPGTASATTSGKVVDWARQKLGPGALAPRLESQKSKTQRSQEFSTAVGPPPSVPQSGQPQRQPAPTQPPRGQRPAAPFVSPLASPPAGGQGQAPAPGQPSPQGQQGPEQTGTTYVKSPSLLTTPGQTTPTKIPQGTKIEWGSGYKTGALGVPTPETPKTVGGAPVEPVGSTNPALTLAGDTLRAVGLPDVAKTVQKVAPNKARDFAHAVGDMLENVNDPQATGAANRLHQASTSTATPTAAPGVRVAGWSYVAPGRASEAYTPASDLYQSMVRTRGDFVVRDIVRRGDGPYVTATVMWNAAAHAFESTSQLMHSVASTIQGAASKRDRHWIGLVGRVRIESIDPKAGVARAVFQTSQAKSFPTEVGTDAQGVDLDR